MTYDKKFLCGGSTNTRNIIQKPVLIIILCLTPFVVYTFCCFIDLLANLERLLLKTLKFEKVLELFSDPSNIDSSSDFANALTKVISISCY